jgi:ABC-type Fe3+/spermidine/putrescine transport system ATPase subunit
VTGGEGGREVTLMSTPPSNALLVLEGVSKLYGAFRAVDGISLQVRQGEILTLLGPSGCGKTTTLRMIAGLERCSEGEIVYRGKVVDSATRDEFLPTDKRNMGMVFQSYAIWPNMSIFENIAFPLRVRGASEAAIRKDVKRVMELVGLEHLEQRRATELSGGQQQRVAVARSLVFNPEILLLDEPFSNLDAKLREHMRLEMKLLQKRLGATIVLVTHDQTEALSLSDRIAVMNSGSIEQIGSPQELYEHPRTPFVRDFLGQRVMFHARIDQVFDDGSVLVTVEGSLEGRYRTRNHLLPAPRAGQGCYLAVRPGDLDFQDGADGRADACGEVVLRGKIDTLLFLGEYFQALVRLENGTTFLAPLPRKSGPPPRPDVRVRLPGDSCVWPE